jgi:acyl-[acyl carrier protein]--UDP-N-acetylglucosamine O-acyltransferase
MSDLYNEDWINIDGNSIHKTAIIHPNVILGKGNTIGAFCVIGGNGEIRNVKQSAFKGAVYIGNDNVISEFVSIQRPASLSATIIGNNNIIMAHSHIGHNAQIDNTVEICSGVIVGGYVQIKDFVKIKLGSVIRNRILIGERAIVGMGAIVIKDVEAGAVVIGNPAKELKR